MEELQVMEQKLNKRLSENVVWIATVKYIHCVKSVQIRSFFLLEKCPNMEFFLVRIFPHLDWTRKDTVYLSVFSPNTGKYRPEKSPYLDTFQAVLKLIG